MRGTSIRGRTGKGGSNGVRGEEAVHGGGPGLSHMGLNQESRWSSPDLQPLLIHLRFHLVISRY